MRLGILGGTFDPIHIGHLILAEESWYQLGLEKVLLVPAADPPHKRDRLLSPVDHRVAMIQLAIADNPHLELSRVDVDRPGPHYTVDMVHLLYDQYGPGTDLYFLMGLDSLADLPNWHQPQKLMELCNLVALTRPDSGLDWDSLEQSLPGIRWRVILLPMPELDISSTMIQQRVRQGRPIRYQVLPPVEDYIGAHGLYHWEWDDDNGPN
jgi:nicotinate-nucleotide adenylyltransferase